MVRQIFEKRKRRENPVHTILKKRKTRKGGASSNKSCTYVLGTEASVGNYTIPMVLHGLHAVAVEPSHSSAVTLRGIALANGVSERITTAQVAITHLKQKDGGKPRTMTFHGMACVSTSSILLEGGIELQLEEESKPSEASAAKAQQLESTRVEKHPALLHSLDEISSKICVPASELPAFMYVEIDAGCQRLNALKPG